MRKDRWVLAWIWCVLLCSLPGVPAAFSAVPRAANPFIIDTWTTDDGLPQNTVTTILQTRDGYLWFGTINGLVRFDGIRFSVFDESNTPGLNNSWIVKLFEDREGNLWAGTRTAGVALIKKGRVSTPIGQSAGRGTSDRQLVSVCQDALGAIWFYMADGQLWRHREGRFDAFVYGLGRRSNHRSIIAEEAGPVWIGADWGVSAIAASPASGSLELPVDQSLPTTRLDYLLASSQGGYWRLADGMVQKCRTNQVTRELSPYRWGIARVSTACEDRRGNLIVGTLGLGVYWFNAEGEYSRLSTLQGLSSAVVLSLCVDREGNLWVGSDGGGLCRIRRRVFEVLDESAGLAASAVQTVSEDAEGGLWIGSNGGGLACWKNEKMQLFGAEQGLANSRAWAVLADSRQRLWAGTWGGGLFQLKDRLFERMNRLEAMPNVGAIHQDHQGVLWFGTQNGLIRCDGEDWRVFTTRDGLSADEVHALADDAEGNLWIGTVGGGLNRLKEGRFTVLHKQPDGLPSEDVSCLSVDRDGVLWVGTPGSGLGRFQKGKWTRFTTREGLTSNSINYLVDDGEDGLWAGSNAGILRLSKAELNAYADGTAKFVSCRAYGKPDGLPTRECTAGSQPAGCRARDGTLWLPTAKGLVGVRPGQLKPNPYPPPVKIESVLIDGQAVSTNDLSAEIAQPVMVKAGKERLEIQYTSLNLAAPDKSRFKYRLEGHEKEWTEAGNGRVARYSKLPPGNYRFQVKACNEDGVWNNTGSILTFTVETPFWRTGWFIGGTAVILLGSIVGSVHYYSTQKLQRQLERLRQQEALDKERQRIAQDIHDQLGANLTSVAMLGEMVESDKEYPEEVESHAKQIAQTARDTARSLDEIVWAVNPTNDTLESLISYACKHAQDFLSVAGLKYRLDMPAQLPHVVIPPEFRHNVFLAFKESLTNVVRHAAASAVQIRLRLESGLFLLEIEDNGRGVAGMDEKAAKMRNGLRGMRKRMESIGGRFEIGPAAETGTLVRLSAPLGKID